MKNDKLIYSQLTDEERQLAKDNTISESSLNAANMAFHLIQVAFSSAACIRDISHAISEKEKEKDSHKKKCEIVHMKAKKSNLVEMLKYINPIAKSFEDSMAKANQQDFYYDKGIAFRNLFKTDPKQHSILLECVESLFVDGLELAEKRMILFKVLSTFTEEQIGVVLSVINGNYRVEDDDLQPKSKSKKVSKKQLELF